MDSFADSPTTTESRHFDQDYDGFDNSQRFDSFDYRDQFDAGDKPGLEDGYDSGAYIPPSYEGGFTPDHDVHDSPSPFEAEFASSPISEMNGHGIPAAAEDIFVQSPSPVFGSANASVLPPPEEMEPEEGHILREWKRQNALHLAEKERIEKERLEQIMDEADEYKRNFYHKRSANVEAQKQNNRNKEQVFLSGQEHFHKTAEKHYWKSVSELVPTEIPSIETKRGNKDKKKTTVIFNQGPKPGKATDMTRMRQVLLKLKHSPPAHMKTAPPPPPPAAPKAKDEAEKNKAEPIVASATPVEAAA